MPDYVRTLVVAPILIGLATDMLYGAWRRIPYTIGHHEVEICVSNAKRYLEVVEFDLRWFYRTFGRLPKDLEELADAAREAEEDAARAYTDPCSLLPGASRARFCYVQLGNTHALLYSIGPDLDDDKAEKEFTEDLFRYHKAFMPWRGMPFRNWLYEASRVSAKFDGDITRTILLKE